jgi:hypothetical protein
MKKLFATAFASLMLVCSMAFAVPSVQQIESAMAQGNWQQADSGLTEVLQAHPNNARAHYLYAQVLVREGRAADALAQIQQAKTLDPQIRFTDPTRFAQTEAVIRRAAERAGTVGAQTGNSLTQQTTPSVQQQAAMVPQAPQRHGPSTGLWIGIALVIAAVALVLRWTLRRARTQDDSRADDDRRTQLKRATDLLNAVRSLKLDLKLSTAAGHEVLEKEVEGTEDQLRGVVEGLSSSKNPLPPYQLDELEQRVASLKARAEGRPDPYAAPAPASGSDSAYAREADRFGNPPQAPYPYPQQQQPPVVVQQGGGFGGGMGGLLTGVLLGQVLSGGREREVIVDDESRRRGENGGGGGNNDGGGLDFGQGSNNWDDGSGGGGVDTGNDDSGGWSDT